MKIIIYSTQISSRLNYITQFIFGDLLGIAHEIVCDWPSEVEPSCFVINYGKPERSGFHIQPSGLLFEKDIREQDLQIDTSGEFVTLYQNGGSGISFDIFSASFFLLSRYEEYLPHARDSHDRFSATQSVAYKNNFLDQPIINIWVAHFASLLRVHYPSIVFHPPAFKFINTIDVDYTHAFMGKDLLRSSFGVLGNLIRGEIKDLVYRLKCYFRLANDPYNTFEWVLDLHKKHGLSSIFFFHVGDYDRYDLSVPLSSSGVKALIKEMNDYVDIGIHTSYASSHENEKLSIELARLGHVIHQPIYKNRFHYIKLQFPQSYRLLIDNGILEDYTMGYADRMGFRAGVCHPFWFYDLDQDCVMPIQIFPFYLMEATAKYYLSESPENMRMHYQYYIDIVKKHRGTFVSLWHNDALSEWGQWKGWRYVYTEMIQYIMDTQENNDTSKKK